MTRRPGYRESARRAKSHEAAGQWLAASAAWGDAADAASRWANRFAAVSVVSAVVAVALAAVALIGSAQ